VLLIEFVQLDKGCFWANIEIRIHPPVAVQNKVADGIGALYAVLVFVILLLEKFESVRRQCTILFYRTLPLLGHDCCFPGLVNYFGDV
jgi:hypothetical protein